MTPEKLKEILEEHRKWRLGEGGSRANLAGANLDGAYLDRAKAVETLRILDFIDAAFAAYAEAEKAA